MSLVSPTQVFMYCIAGAAGIAVGVLLIAVILGATYIVGSALLRRFIGGRG